MAAVTQRVYTIEALIMSHVETHIVAVTFNRAPLS